MSERNPFGAIDPQDMKAFEETLGRALPASYRQYLLDYNGGIEEARIYQHGSKPLDFSVNVLFGIHNGPPEKRLDVSYRPWDYFDLASSQDALKGFICIGTTTTGDLLLIDLSGGGVHLLSHDNQFGSYEIAEVAETFKSFHQSLVSEAEFRAAIADTEFERRLAEMKQQRARDVADYIKRNGQ